MRHVSLGLLVLLVALLPRLPGHAGETDSKIPDAWIVEALEAANDNRGELERVLAHFAKGADPQRLEAARFLIANMPGHGYVLTELRDAEGRAVEYDPLAYDTFQESLEALEALETEHGELDFARDRIVLDVETIQADYLIRHIDAAFEAWEAVTEGRRVGFDAFQDFVLPYRGSQEPLDAWIGPCRERYGAWWAEESEDVAALRKRLSKDVHQRVRFNERYYLHPTDQGFKEMVVSGQGRCEDITNMMTYASRSVALATAADYTPAWAHRDNNHAWNVLLDADGKGSAPSNAHAAKVYRKTFALQRDNLAFRLEEGEEAPNRFLSSKTYLDVTNQYRTTTNVAARFLPEVAKGHRFAYLCVFNGGEWTAIHWAEVNRGGSVFDRMGRNIVYLPAVFAEGELKPAAVPLLVHANGTVQHLRGTGGPADVVVTAVKPRQKSVDTHVETPVSYLEAGETYVVRMWTRDGWKTIEEKVATEKPLRLFALPSDGLYWVVKKESRRLERVFTIHEGRQRWW